MEVVLLGNIIGTGVAAWAFEHMPIFDEETRDAFVKIGMDVRKLSCGDVFQRHHFWLVNCHDGVDVPAAGAAKIWSLFR